MKKINIFSLAIAISFSLSFSSLISGCEDVPAPYEVNIDDNGGGTGTTLTGDGTVTSPYTVADIKTLLDANTLSSTTYAFVQGRVSQFDSLSLSYGNAYYNISADGLASGTQLIVYRGYYTAGSKFTSDSQALSAGDSVVVYGTFQIYSSKYEINQGSKIAYLNGTSYDVAVVDGSSKVKSDAKQLTIAEFIQKASADTVFQVTGVVSDIKNTTYGNYTLTDETGSIAIYGTLTSLGESQKFSTLDVAAGDTVTLQGTYTLYGTTHEIANAIFVSRKKASASTSTTETGTSQIKSDAAQITIADFLSKADTVVTYQLTGVVDSIVNTTYGNFYLADATGSVYVYGLLTSTGVSKQFSSLNIAKGDTVTLQGVYCEYNGTPEIKNAIFVSVKNAGSTSSTPTTGDETTPDSSTSIEISGTLSEGLSMVNLIDNLTQNNYGTQTVADASTWFSWKFDGITFTGAKICKSASTTCPNTMQMQGNASDNAKQGFFFNVDAMPSDIKSITLVLNVKDGSSAYDPSYSLYVGNESHPLTDALTATATDPAYEVADGIRTYTQVFELGDKSCKYFTVYNDKAGALYISKLIVTLK